MLTQPQYKLTDPEVALGASHSCPAAAESDLDRAVSSAAQALEAQQHADGHWLFELEADCTIPSEYIMMMHFMDEVDEALERKIAVYLRRRQAAHGGWPLYHGGAFDLSCSVKAYFALKLAGDDPAEPHMVRAREAILAQGGAAQSNVFTRIALALFEQVPWRAVPFIPVEVMLLPRWFPFHIDKVSYWSRTVMVPLFILCTLKPRAANPRGVDIGELFVTPPDQERHYFHPKNLLGHAFLWLDKAGRLLEPLVPGFIRRQAIKKAENWFVARLNGSDGLGGIFPAMVNAYESLALLGYPADHPHRTVCRDALRKLLVVGPEEAYCQPCLSPVWDTAIACHALHEAKRGQHSAAVERALDWLRDRQLTDEPGDWRNARPQLAGGGWPFQFRNDFYPDLDDTSMVAWGMRCINGERYAETVQRATGWIHGMQSGNGGFASFEVDNTQYYLNYIPFADHGALLDPPTADVTARCIALLSLMDRERYADSLKTALDYVKAEQEADGSWFGRWGTNYIYGTWSVLAALEVAGEDPGQDYIRRAAAWLESVQNDDGGWGESNDSYYPDRRPAAHPSTAFQTAWAVLGLMAAGEAGSETVRRGIDFMLARQRPDGLWWDEDFTAPGFPRVFYLRYHGYTRYFPLWALARFRNLAGDSAG